MSHSESSAPEGWPLPATSLLAAIVSSSDDAIVSKDLRGIVTSWNQGAERMFGYRADEMIGQSVLKLVPLDRKEEEPQILARLARGERVDHFETLRVRKNGEHFPVSLTISPVKDARGVVVGASKIARDISYARRVAAEREQLLESERAARAQAERANRMKDEFMAVVSHELRTPLNAIVGWIQVLKEAGDDPATLAEGLEVIGRNASMQAQLIEDLLDLGRIASGKMKLEFAPVDLHAVTRDAISSVALMAREKSLLLDFSPPGDSGDRIVLGDRKRLQQAIWNLLANAIKFTPDHGRITVEARTVGGGIELVVRDTGRGIPADFLPHVFERFRQVDSTLTRQAGGLGIGLSIVKQLVELHGGTIRAESPGEGRGATFTITLPLSKTLPRVRPEGEAAAVPGSSRAPSSELDGIRVLAVDDDRDSLEVLRRILGHRKAQVATASSVGEALDLLRSFTPDVILSDIGMPGRDGYDLIRQARTLPGIGGIPAAALTAMARPEDRMRALDAGFQTHVAKPLAPSEVVAVVRSLAALHGHAGGAPGKS